MANRFIESLKGFAALSVDDENAVAVATAIPRKYAARRDLIREGDRPGPVLVILEGWACCYKILPSGTRQVLAFMMPGDCCDLHIGLLAEMDHNIQTITPALVATIDRVTMDMILDDRRAVAKAMHTSQLVDEATLRAWIPSMGRRVSIDQIAHFMCELYLRARNIGLTCQQHFALSQLLLADALGMTSVHLNRVLKELRLRSAMALQRGNLIITDPRKLVQIAGFDENYLHRRLRTVVSASPQKRSREA